MAEEGEASDRQIYELQVRGWPSESWSDWFGGMTIAAETVDEGSVITALRGTFADQAALRGILTRLWDLNLTLLSVSRREM